MGKLNKFENVDVTASLEAIMKQNTAFYQSDFDIDKEIIKRAAESPNAPCPFSAFSAAAYSAREICSPLLAFASSSSAVRVLSGCLVR